jgi:hypothetical protein
MASFNFLSIFLLCSQFLPEKSGTKATNPLLNNPPKMMAQRRTTLSSLADHLRTGGTNSLGH